VIQITPDPVAVQIGPLSIPWYGVGYAVALIVGTWLAQREAERRGISRQAVTDAILPVVLLGIVGARLYHVIDEWETYASNPLAIVLPPYSGLALYGGVAGGIVGVVLFARRRGLPVVRGMDAAVPSLFLGQAIARWGNFFNQELYGPPTDLPWGIAIDCAHRVVEWSCDRFPVESTGFHPLFLYESLLTLAGAGVALWLSRRRFAALRDGDLMALWFVWYGAARIALEGFRTGYNWTIGGVPTATLLGAVAILLGVALFVTRDRRSRSAPDGDVHAEDAPDEGVEGDEVRPVPAADT
jgi:phosphatidylglycerol:prolipoprotein diacylglycerol transferase